MGERGTCQSIWRFRKSRENGRQGTGRGMLNDAMIVASDVVMIEWTIVRICSTPLESLRASGSPAPNAVVDDWKTDRVSIRRKTALGLIKGNNGVLSLTVLLDMPPPWALQSQSTAITDTALPLSVVFWVKNGATITDGQSFPRLLPPITRIIRC